MEQLSVNVRPTFVQVSEGYDTKFINTNCISEIRPSDYRYGDYTIYYKGCNDAGAERICKGTISNNQFDCIV